MADIIKNTKEMAHELFLRDRKSVRLTGVTEVDSFDDTSVVLKTVCGELTVDGVGLRISSLDTTNGTLEITGNVEGLSYYDRGKDTKRGLFGRVIG